MQLAIDNHVNNRAEREAINNHLKTTNSGWYKVIGRHQDGSILIEHGTYNRQYIKKLKVNNKGINND